MGFHFPGRCPGLSCYALAGLGVWAAIVSHVRRGGGVGCGTCEHLGWVTFPTQADTMNFWHGGCLPLVWIGIRTGERPDS